MLWCACAFVQCAFASADDDWQKILDMESAPRLGMVSREDARAAALEKLAQQETALRAFAREHPEDPRSFDASLRLAHVLAVRGDFDERSKGGAEAQKLLQNLAKKAPPDRAADVAFAKISLAMRAIRTNDAATRERLLGDAEGFRKAFPQDRRVAPLLAEIATLFDDDPAEKAALLKRADAVATDAETKARITDDLKRVAQFGRKVELQAPEFNVATYRGKVVVICWFADWSPPAMQALKGVRDALAGFSRAKVQPLGVSLDQDRAVLAKNIADLKLDWPIAFDGKGWDSPLARTPGINALPTVWVLDGQGRLRVLNVRGNLEALIEQLLQEK